MDKGSSSDVVNAILGAFLFVSPWLFAFSTDSTASWNAWLSGIVIVVLAVAALSVFAEWQEWLSVLVGIWVVISPWLLNFSGNETARWLHVAVGVVVALVAAVRVWRAYEGV